MYIFKVEGGIYTYGEVLGLLQKSRFAKVI